MKKNFFRDKISAYEHCGDDLLLEKLGLKVFKDLPLRKWHFLGTHSGYSLDNPQEQKNLVFIAKVWVIGYPAQFWKIRIVRPKPAKEVHIMETGSGSFGSFWPIAERIGRNHFTVKQVQRGDAR